MRSVREATWLPVAFAARAVRYRSGTKMPMETAETLHDLKKATGKFAQAAVEAAMARREEITSELLRILEETEIVPGAGSCSVCLR
jgi:hypothetical protein